MAVGELGEIVGAATIEEQVGQWTFDDDDWALIAMLQDPIYMAELLFQDPKNREWHGTYHVRDYQVPLFRSTHNYEAFPTARDVGKTESQKAKAVCHAFRRIGEDMLLTAPETIHLEGLTKPIENRINDTRLTREFLRRDSQKTGFTHKPFECIAEGELVLTSRGHVPIENVAVGDLVLTHRGRWRPVSAVWDRGVRKVSTIRASGSAGLRATPDHRLLVKRIRQRQGIGETGKRRMYWDTWPSEWMELQQCRTRMPATRLGFPADVDALRPPDPFRLNLACGPSGKGKGALVDPTSPDFLWVLGHFLAEGCTWDGKIVALGIHQDECDEVLERLRRVGIRGRAARHKGTLGAQVHISSQPLAQFLEEHIPAGARAKDLPAWVYGLDRAGRQALLDGLLYGDGHRTPAGSWEGSLASRPLVQAIVVLAHGLGYAAGTGFVPAESHEMKTGQVIDAGEQWKFYVNPEPQRSHCHVRFEDGSAWTAVTKLEDAGTARVYDLTVEDDHSFIASGVVVHNCVFADGTRLIGRIPHLDGSGVKGPHVPDLLMDEAQDYPENGWTEVIPTVIKDHTDADGDYDFTLHFYGVHAGGVAGGTFATLSESASYKTTQITMLQKPGWNKQEKEAFKAMYGGVNTPDYRRNVLGERGSRVSQFFSTARLMACVDQDRDSEYNTSIFKAQEFDGDSLEDLVARDGNVGDLLDLPEGLGQQVYGGMDVGLVSDPTVITLWAPLMDKKAKRPRLSLVRMIHLHRFTERQIRQMTYRIGLQYGLTLRSFGQDITGLGLPLYQAMDADEQCPVHLREVSRGYVFNAKVPVSVDKNYVSEQGSQLVDQYGHIVEVVHDKWTGTDQLVARMTMIEASTRYLRGFVDDGFLRLPFHESLVKDFQGESEQRVRAMSGVRKKPNAFHMLDSARAFAMAYKASEMEEQVYSRPKGPVLDRAPDFRADSMAVG